MRCLIWLISLLPGLGMSAALKDVGYPQQQLKLTPPHESRDSATEPDLLPLLRLRSAGIQARSQELNRILHRCDTCHSRTMVESNGYLPILQGQNLEYLFTKLQMFRQNKSSRHPFPGDSQALTLEQVMDISHYYSAMSSTLELPMMDAEKLPQAGRSPQWSGEDELNRCKRCHGDNGNGNQTIPALSGQNINYLAYRIRQIASDSSSIHVEQSNPLGCRIESMTIRKSRSWARRLGQVEPRQTFAQ